MVRKRTVPFGYNALGIKEGHVALCTDRMPAEMSFGAVRAHAVRCEIGEPLLALEPSRSAAVYSIGVGVPVLGSEGYGDYPSDLIDLFNTE